MRALSVILINKYDVCVCTPRCCGGCRWTVVVVDFGRAVQRKTSSERRARKPFAAPLGRGTGQDDGNAGWRRSARASERSVNGMSRAIHHARAQHLDRRGRRTVHDLCTSLTHSCVSLLISLSLSLAARPSVTGRWRVGGDGGGGGSLPKRILLAAVPSNPSVKK